MRALLEIQEVGTTRWVEHGEFQDEPKKEGESSAPGESLAEAEGARLCQEGSAQAFRVWGLLLHAERTITVRRVEEAS